MPNFKGFVEDVNKTTISFKESSCLVNLLYKANTLTIGSLSNDDDDGNDNENDQKQ